MLVLDAAAGRERRAAAGVGLKDVVALISAFQNGAANIEILQRRCVNLNFGYMPGTLVPIELQ